MSDDLLLSMGRERREPHDPLCPREALDTLERRDDICMCVWIRMARDDERRRIAANITKKRVLHAAQWDPAYADAVLIARSGGLDEA